MIKINHYGRLGNIMFQDVGASILSKKFNLRVLNYKNSYDGIDIKLHNEGRSISNNLFTITDDNLDEVLQMKNIDAGIEICSYFQTKFFVSNFKNEIKEHFKNNEVLKNNSVFVHVRLGDAISKNSGINYYQTCLEKIQFSNGYISSDDPNNELVLSLSEKYNLSIYNESPGKTILEAKNFDNIILSGGTFSWWIAFLSKASKIFYPKNYLNWHGDIFVYKNWNGITC